MLITAGSKTPNSSKSSPFKIIVNTMPDKSATVTGSTSQILTQSKRLVIPKITVRTATPLNTGMKIPEITIRTATPQVAATSTSTNLTQQFIQRAKLSKELNYLKDDLKIMMHSIDTIY